MYHKFAYMKASQLIRMKPMIFDGGFLFLKGSDKDCNNKNGRFVEM